MLQKNQRSLVLFNKILDEVNADTVERKKEEQFRGVTCACLMIENQRSVSEFSEERYIQLTDFIENNSVYLKSFLFERKASFVADVVGLNFMKYYLIALRYCI